MFNLRISAEAVRHIDSRHVQNPPEVPLWTEFLGSPADIATALERAVERSLQRPLYVEYDQHDSSGVLLHTTRECVTRAGIIAVVRLTDASSGSVGEPDNRDNA